MYLELHDITKTYKEQTAIDHISFNVEKGSMLCLLGPSGCGKTTILKAIGGFITVDTGRILLDGQDITKTPPESRNVSTVFQSYGLFPHMNVLHNITYGLKFKAVPKKERIAMGMQMMETMGLQGYEKKYAAELSGGEQQRVALARSLIIKPKLLLLDEPLSNLDAKLRLSMRKEIKRIQKTFNITTIFVTHDQSEAFELADTIILLHKGTIMQHGSAQELYNNPHNDFVRNFIGVHNKVGTGYVRPEKITVLKSYTECNNGAMPLETRLSAQDGIKKAIVTDIIFKGECFELYVQTADILLKALVLNDGTVYQKGETVYIKIQVSD